MKIFDTLAREKITLGLPHDRMIKMYVCGPTVQDNFHIGHARTYIFFDSLAKYLRINGYRVFYLQNITDIDDKIIDRAKAENVDFQVISRRYTAEFYALMKALKIDSVNLYALATDHITEIISQVKRLVEAGFAYETGDGVYFSVSRFPDYGKLWGQDPQTLLAGTSANLREDKRDPRDFVIWKKMKPGEPYWDSPWGKGRPGWHIEDTAITEAYFGPAYNIHGGGMDLIFPHHDAEIAISRSLSGLDRLSDYWIHTGMVNVNLEKMSKSLKNFVTIREVLASYGSEEIRYALLNANFSTAINYSESLLQESRAVVNQLSILYNKMRIKAGHYVRKPGTNETIERLNGIVGDNMDFRGLFRDVMNLLGTWNASLESMSEAELLEALSVLDWLDSFTGIIRHESASTDISGPVGLLLRIRSELRSRREFQLADTIRSSLLSMGIYIEDRGAETLWWIDTAGVDKK